VSSPAGSSCGADLRRLDPRCQHETHTSCTRLPRNARTRPAIAPSRTYHAGRALEHRAAAGARPGPLPTTSFVPRAQELVRLEQVLGESRLVTITGAGGCGKTRLALELARAQVDRFADGVWLAERLLRCCSGLRVLATTRERLDIPGETVHRVTGLAVPAEDATPDDVACLEAGQLFVE
jgi:hypothetical protein